MGALILFVQGVLGDSFYGSKGPVKMAWLVYWKKEEESVESNAFMPLLDNLEREKQKIF